MKPNVLASGDTALLVQFGDEIDLAINRRVFALETLLREHARDGIIETVPAYASLLIHYDPLQLTYAEASSWVREEIERVEEAATRKPRRIEVPVRYGGEAGADLASVAEYHHLREDEVIRIHANREYVVFMMGFTPGFPYMGKLDEAIATPRLEKPRTSVAAGSVGIAGAQTGVYPIDSPGGWRLIGRTSLQLFDLTAEPPFLFAPGDAVQFVIEAIDA